jgi:hypothetical protein
MDDNFIQLFKYTNKVLVKAQRFRTNKEVSKLPDWFDSITKTIREENPSISLLAIEGMIEILISDKKDPIYNNLKTLII